MGQQLIQVLGRLLSITEIFWSRTWALPCVGLKGSPEQVHPRPPKPLGPAEAHGCRVPAFAPSWAQSGLPPSSSSHATDPPPPPRAACVGRERVSRRTSGHVGPDWHRLLRLSPTWDPTGPPQSLRGVSGLRADPPSGAIKSQHPASSGWTPPPQPPAGAQPRPQGTFSTQKTPRPPPPLAF